MVGRHSSSSPDFLLVHLLSLIRHPAGQALDAGCGSGRNLSYLEGLGYSVVSLDRAPGVHIRADIRYLPLSSNAFNLVLCDGVLDTSPYPPECAILEVHRVLGPGGYLAIVVAAAEGSGAGITFSKDTVMGWAEGLQVLELLYVRVEHPPVIGVRAQWALLAQRR